MNPLARIATGIVRRKKCLYCHQYIGFRRYVEITILKRFGQLLFAHESCEEESNAKDRKKAA